MYLPGTATDVGLDVGAGFAFDVLPVLSVGPFARFSHVFDGREGRATLWLPYERQASQDTDDIHWWTAGIALSVHLAPKPPRERVAGHEQRDDDGATPTDGASPESTDASTPGKILGADQML